MIDSKCRCSLNIRTFSLLWPSLIFWIVYETTKTKNKDNTFSSQHFFSFKYIFIPFHSTSLRKSIERAMKTDYPNKLNYPNYLNLIIVLFEFIIDFQTKHHRRLVVLSLYYCDIFIIVLVFLVQCLSTRENM